MNSLFWKEVMASNSRRICSWDLLLLRWRLRRVIIPASRDIERERSSLHSHPITVKPPSAWLMAKGTVRLPGLWTTRPWERTSGGCVLMWYSQRIGRVAAYSHNNSRHSKSSHSWNVPSDVRMYINNIGVPLSVPDEFKARNHLASGFKPSLFWWVTINKNVDWINYIYNNQERIVHYTTDVVRGISRTVGSNFTYPPVELSASRYAASRKRWCM